MVGWTWMVGLFLGATSGSFLNVVIYRLPRGLSLSNPPQSFCPNCKHPLTFLDMFPLLSWVIQRGKCRYCKAGISSRYFFVELVNGIIWAGIWYQYMILDNDVPLAVAYALAASALVVAIFVDLELYIIPDQVNAFLLFVGIGYNVWLFKEHSPAAYMWGLPVSIAGGLVGVGILWGIAFFGRLAFGKDAMGHGDIKMARGIGAILFPGLATISFGLAVLLGAVLGILQVVLFKAKAGSDTNGDGPGKAGPEGEEIDLPPETIGSLLKCGLGYVLCIDIVGLFFPKLYMWWFHEDPYLPIQEMDEFKVELTMIPFGPYLALGAIAAAVFKNPLLAGWEAYVHSMKGASAMMEHWSHMVGLF